VCGGRLHAAGERCDGCSWIPCLCRAVACQTRIAFAHASPDPPASAQGPHQDQLTAAQWPLLDRGRGPSCAERQRNSPERNEQLMKLPARATTLPAQACIVAAYGVCARCAGGAEGRTGKRLRAAGAMRTLPRWTAPRRSEHAASLEHPTLDLALIRCLSFVYSGIYYYSCPRACYSPCSVAPAIYAPEQRMSGKLPAARLAASLGAGSQDDTTGQRPQDVPGVCPVDPFMQLNSRVGGPSLPKHPPGTAPWLRSCIRDTRSTQAPSAPTVSIFSLFCCYRLAYHGRSLHWQRSLKVSPSFPTISPLALRSHGKTPLPAP
jgi:hypothetical protein